MSTCNICEEKFNKSSRAPVCCLYCDFTSCVKCSETYILDQSIPKCMNVDCKKEWSRKFLQQNFSKTFLMKKYTRHVEDILFDQERALLPATQPIVEQVIRKEKAKMRISEINELIRELKKEKEFLQIVCSEDDTRVRVREHERFVRACPASNCRGFLDSKWTCGLCETVTCRNCHEIKTDEEHVCDPNSIETARLLERDTKPCPTCHTQIFKISGCDQMWCTQCHTAFSWKTGAIEKNIHNPHYYEWRRENGGMERAVGDVECGRELNQHIVSQLEQAITQKHTTLFERQTRPGFHISRWKITFDPAVQKTINIIMNLIHMMHISVREYQTDFATRNQTLRVKYLRQQITEQEFKTTVQRNDKKNRKNREIVQVLQLMNTVCTDIVYRVVENFRTAEENEYDLSIIEEFDEIKKHCNVILDDISKTYSCVKMVFTETLLFKPFV